MQISEEEIIPGKFLRRLNALFLHNETLRQDRDLQDEIVAWAKGLMSECHKEWCEMRATTIDTITYFDRKEKARKARQYRDIKYAPFREHFKKAQYEKFLQYKKEGKNLSANAFVNWYLCQESPNMLIP